MGNVWPEAYEDDTCNFLSPLGVKQAEIAAILIERQPDVILSTVACSALTRARHTLTTMLQQMGDWQRRPDVYKGLNERFPEADAAEHKKRVEAAFEQFMASWTEGDALLVTHYYTMQVIFEWLGFDLQDILEDGWQIPNASVFVYDLDSETLELLDAYDQATQH
jgi:broad specificity phosphatase PhoE